MKPGELGVQFIHPNDDPKVSDMLAALVQEFEETDRIWTGRHSCADGDRTRSTFWVDFDEDEYPKGGIQQRMVAVMQRYTALEIVPVELRDGVEFDAPVAIGGTA